MAITIGSNSITSSGSMDMRVSTSNIVERLNGSYLGGNDYQPAFSYHGSNGWVYFTASTNQEMTNSRWGSPQGYQKGAGSYGMNANFRYYAPRSGYYYFHADFYVLNDTNDTANYIHIWFAKNGSTSWNNGQTPHNIYGHGNNRGAGASYPAGPNLSAVIYLDEGQYCSTFIYKGNSSNCRFYAAHSAFYGHLIT